jgi:hypothetical protein
MTPAVRSAFAAPRELAHPRLAGIVFWSTLSAMPNTLTPSTPQAVAELCSSLDPARQSSLLAFAHFLKSQEAQAALERVDEDDESAWERDFGDPAKTAKFARWADESLAHEKPKQIDPARL